MLPISNVAILIFQFQLVIGNIDNWQHFHIGNIYIPVLSTKR